MFESHPTFLEPDPGATVWRYMDFTKFVAMIDTEALWFAKPALLGDPWELAYTRSNHERWIVRRGLGGNEVALSDYRANLQSMFVNCWHAGEGESAAMWRLYLSAGEGVAVQSSWSDLTSSIKTTRDPVHGGMVRYINFELDNTDDNDNIFFPSTTKRESFSYESEARLVCWRRPFRLTGVPDREQVPDTPGIMVPVDLATLVHRVVLSPNSAPWFKALVHQVAARYDFYAQIDESTMDAEPIAL